MFENPYESPLAANPLLSRNQHRAFKYLGPIEYVILFGYIVLILAATGARLISRVPGIGPDRLDQFLSIGLIAALTLVSSTGLRGLYFVLRRKQTLAVVNGSLCVLGFLVILLLGLLVAYL
jgi:hypothetical protein